MQIVLNESFNLLTGKIKVDSVRVDLDISEIGGIVSLLLLEEYVLLTHLSVGILLVHY